MEIQRGEKDKTVWGTWRHEVKGSVKTEIVSELWDKVELLQHVNPSHLWNVSGRVDRV